MRIHKPLAQHTQLRRKDSWKYINCITTKKCKILLAREVFKKEIFHNIEGRCFSILHNNKDLILELPRNSCMVLRLLQTPFKAYYKGELYPKQAVVNPEFRQF